MDSAFLKLQKDQRVKAVQTLVAMAERARKDPAVFAEMVLREERTQRAIRVAPHQRLLINFALRHPLCLVRMPVGASKTYMMTALGLWFLGKNPTSRGAIISASSQQAKQPLGWMRQYIESSPQIRTVFPNLQPSSNPADPWREDRLTIRRPIGIKDPSMRAIGLDGKLAGARLSWALVDDILDLENTATPEARAKVYNFFDTTVLSRLDPTGSRLVVTNTPWDREDITYTLEKLKWPALTMGVDGFIKFGNLSEERILKLFGDLVRKSRRRAGSWRLAAFEDPDELSSLWPARYSNEWIAWKRETSAAHTFARMYLCEPMDASAARCPREWIDKAFAAGAGLTFPTTRTALNPVYIGVDIGGVEKGSDLSAICAIELQHDERRKILSLESGRWTGKELIARIRAVARRYDATVFVESNAAQKFIAEFLEDSDRNLRVVRFNTTALSKHDVHYGVESVFTELARESWIWPAGPDGKVHPELDKLSQECQFFNPANHTGDLLMSLFLARQGLKKHGVRQGADVGGPKLEMAMGGGF